jgi:hypothetical protein
VLQRRRHRKNSLFLSASAAGIIVGLLVSVSTGLAVSLSAASAAQADSSSSQTVRAKDSDPTRLSDPTLARAPMPNLAVTVSQTTNLLSQAVVVSWTGAEPSTDVSNYLQIAQCWGEDPENPGHPDRTTCQYGGFGSLAATREGGAACKDTGKPDVNDETQQLPVIDPHDYVYTTGRDANYLDESLGCGQYYTAIPYESASGAGIVASVLPDPTGADSTGRRQHYVPYKGIDPTYAGTIQNYSGDPVVDGSFQVPTVADVPAQAPASQVVGVDLASNQFYTPYTTNEVTWAGSSSQGSGSIKFEIQTAVQAPGLGCGADVLDPATGVSGPQSCWLVVIPRGTKDSGATNISKSGLLWDAWQHNIAVKLDFKPIAQRCAVGGTEKQLSGSELVAEAVSSWQPKLCQGAAGASFVMSSGNEASALTKASGVDPSPLALTTRPLKTRAKDPVQYAPVAISGLVLSFSIDRRVTPVSDPQDPTPVDYVAKTTEAFSKINLTPRIVAKLLTGSYWESLPKGADLTHIGFSSVNEPGPNARTMTKDEDFLQVNDKEWRYQDLTGPSLGDLLVPSGQSDEGSRLWEYVLSDPEAVAFLSGTPDPWGMKVNPYYATTASAWSAVAMSYPIPTFPKADPVASPNTFEATPNSGNNSVNLITWRPFTSNFSNGAYRTLRGDGLELGSWNDAKKTYDKSVRNPVGRQRVIAVTTAAAASRYQTISASLKNPAGEFVSASSSSMSAAVAAMQGSETNSSVVEFNLSSDSAKSAKNAYPLTMPIYAALNPLQSDSSLRTSYAALIRYAVGEGQSPGTGIGQLPDGYVSLPQSWIDQAMVSANAIEQGVSPLSLVSPVRSIPGAVYAPAIPVPQIVAPVADTTVTATGTASGPLVGKPTPADPVLGPVAAAVPAGLLSGFAAAAAVPLYSRLRRKP